MVRIIFFVICLVATFCGSSTSTNIECLYGKYGSYYVLGHQYLCIVNNNPNLITEEAAQISEISGSHKSSKGNDDVIGFEVNEKTLHVFPKGLEKFFKNLKIIRVYYSDLKEIHQQDLNVFPDLVYFYLWGNSIEVIEEGLFYYNPNLELIAIRESKIIHMDPYVFDNLHQLSSLQLYGVPCANQYISNTKVPIPDVIYAVKSKCSNSEYSSLANQIKRLEIESKTLNSEALNIKLKSFEENLKNSRFSKLRSLKHKVQNLKPAINSTKINQVQNVSIPDINNINLSNDLKSTKTLSDIKFLVNAHGSKLDQLQTSQNMLNTSMSNSINKLGSELSSKVNEIPKIQTTLTGHGSSLTALSSTLKNITSTLDNLKTSNEEISKTMADLKTEMDTKIDEKLEFFEDSLTNSESRNGRKIDEIKKELDQLRYKLSVSIDTKLKNAENRMMEKLDKILNALNVEN